MTTPRIAAAALWTGLAGTVVGCASPPTSYHDASISAVRPQVHRSMVTPEQPMQSSATDWQLSRNDELLGLSPSPAGREASAVTVYSRDRIRTINGRPVDTSSTTTWSIRRQLRP